MEDEAAIAAVLRAFAPDEPTLVRDTPRGTLWRSGTAALRVDTRPEVPVEQMIEAGYQLSEAGVACVRPLALESWKLPSGALASVWAWLDRRGTIDLRQVGVAMNAFHQRAPAGAAFTTWEDVYAFNCNQLAALIDPSIAPADDLATLRDRLAAGYSELGSLLRTCPTVTCHGDLHPDNLMQTASGPIMLDLEMCQRAPAETDFAPLWVRTHLYDDHTPADMDSVFEGYVDGIDRSVVQRCGELRALVEVAGVGAYASASRKHVPEFRKRLAWAVNGESPKWTWPDEEKSR